MILRWRRDEEDEWNNRECEVEYIYLCRKFCIPSVPTTSPASNFTQPADLENQNNPTELAATVWIALLTALALVIIALISFERVLASKHRAAGLHL